MTAPRERAVKLRDQGKSVRMIAAELQMPLSTVGGWLREDRPLLEPHRPREFRSYKVVGVAQPKGQTPKTYKITIPPHIGIVIPDNVEFIPELTEDGILLRRVDTIPPADLPSWVSA